LKKPAVKIRGLKKSFGDVKALDGVELTIKQGEFLHHQKIFLIHGF
jgi:ABC-type Fe3+/spermidine/putrescine transport system ATPase subunit